MQGGYAAAFCNVVRCVRVCIISCRVLVLMWVMRVLVMHNMYMCGCPGAGGGRDVRVWGCMCVCAGVSK